MVRSALQMRVEMALDVQVERLLIRADEALNANQLASAESAYRAVLEDQPENAYALGRLGLVLHSLKRFAEAELVFKRLTELHPGELLYWMNLGTARRCAGDPDAALYAFARGAALGANSADFYYNVALAHIDRNDYEAARELLSKAFALEPADDEIRYRYAACCYECMKVDEALAALDTWHDSNEQSDVAANIGQLLMKLGEPARAEPAVRRAAHGTDDSRARLTLAQVLERTNRVDEARHILLELEQNRDAVAELGSELTLLKAQLAQRTGEHELAARLFEEVLDGCTELHTRHFQEYPLAKSLDAAGRYEEAFGILTSAHRSQLAYLQRSAPLTVLRGGPPLAIAEHDCDPDDVARWEHSSAPTAEDSPVFIVAFPRSGTTLLELTLDAHPALVSMDEQPFLQNALDDLMQLGVRYPVKLALATSAQLNEVRENYWKRVRRKVDVQPGQRLVDKNPLNMLRLPLIKRLFPNSHVLMAIRHPCDVILSCFMQHFRAPDFVLLCRDLPTLAKNYRKAFDFWYRQQVLLQPRSMELRYESFVDTFAAQTHSIVDFLGLPWDDAVLAPGERALEKRFISTPSYSQVVQPVTKKAIGRWHNYREHFEQCLPILQPYLDRWGYES
jgi:tetratricopeptide (TPR) repeat protein